MATSCSSSPGSRGSTGYLPRLHGSPLPVGTLEVIPGVPWRSAVTALLPYLKRRGEELAARDGASRLASLGFWWLGREHPLCRALHLTDFARPAALYVRVPDLARFLRVVGPVLARRLAASPMAGYTGLLRISSYRDGVELGFEDGALVRAEAWRPPLAVVGQEMGRPSRDPRRADALFPGLTFLQLAFGSRSLEQLEDAFPDCLVRTGEGRALLEAMFPKQPSDVWPVL